jgi:hypothetical protein
MVDAELSGKRAQRKTGVTALRGTQVLAKDGGNVVRSSGSRATGDECRLHEGSLGQEVLRRQRICTKSGAKLAPLYDVCVKVQIDGVACNRYKTCSAKRVIGGRGRNDDDDD